MKNGRWWLFLLLSSAAIVCFCAAVYRSQRFTAMSGCTVLRYEKPSLTIEAVEDALENARAHEGKVLDAILWSEYEDEAVLDEWQRKAMLRVLHVYGDGARAYPVNCVAGAYPVRGDAEGCAVDRQAADALFGSQDVLGNTLTWQGKPYIVRGVLTGMEGVVVIQAGDAEEIKFDTLALFMMPDVNGREAAEAFLSSGGIMVPNAILDTLFQVQFVDALALLPPWVIAITLIVKMIAQTLRMRAVPILCLCAAAVTVAAAAMVLYAAQFSPPLPDRLLPTKWSDFSFWKGLAAQWQAHAREIRSVNALISDYMRSNAAIYCGIFTTCAIACFTEAMAVMPSFSLRRLLIAAFWTVGLTFLLLLLFSASGKPVDAPRALWLTWVLYIMLASIFQREFRYTGADMKCDDKMDVDESMDDRLKTFYKSGR